LGRPVAPVEGRDFIHTESTARLTMAKKGRPTTWTRYKYHTLFQCVILRRGRFGESVRCACRYISQREPWRGLSAATLRRWFSKAARLSAQGELQVRRKGGGLDFNFRPLTEQELIDMMVPRASIRYPKLVEELLDDYSYARVSTGA
jgi:hypothetical protein